MKKSLQHLETARIDERVKAKLFLIMLLFPHFASALYPLGIKPLSLFLTSYQQKLNRSQQW